MLIHLIGSSHCSYFGCIRRTFFMTSEILLSARKLFCTLMLFSTSVDCLLSLMDECGDFLVERGVGRTSLEGSGEEGTWPALAGRSLCRIKHTIKVHTTLQFPANSQWMFHPLTMFKWWCSKNSVPIDKLMTNFPDTLFLQNDDLVFISISRIEHKNIKMVCIAISIHQDFENVNSESCHLYII